MFSSWFFRYPWAPFKSGAAHAVHFPRHFPDVGQHQLKVGLLIRLVDSNGSFIHIHGAFGGKTCRHPNNMPKKTDTSSRMARKDLFIIS
jgi:hypothetical protein